MISLQIAIGLPSVACEYPTIIDSGPVCVRGLGVYHTWKNAAGASFVLLGNVDGMRQADGSLSAPSTLKAESHFLEDSNCIPRIEGRFILLSVSEVGVCELWTDQFGRIDVYWQLLDGGMVIGTSLDLLPVAQRGSSPDPVGLAHSLTVYGARPAKQHTLYRGVRRLGVNQGLRASTNGVEILHREFKPASTSPLYGPKDLHRYADYFLEAIRSRASATSNVVYLSSGWDSTSILAALVHLFGNRKVRAVIGRMRYSERSGVINQFEIVRASAVAAYFGVRLDIIELDYRTNAREVLNQVQGHFRSQQFANLTGVNHWKLAEGTAKTADGDEVIFAGEMSDGAHNLGFSQFTTIFHPASLDFREYSDKMASYLFGPTFLEQLQKNAHEQDPVWQLIKQRAGSTIFDKVSDGKEAVALQLLSSFFLRGGRIPLYSIENTRILTASGKEKYTAESENIYLREISASVTQENIYAYYLHLYNSFHWQGSTVATLEFTAEHFGLKCVLPFHDSAVIEFLSAMPESWGRGLDLNPTKYPLKWMLRNRIDYPHHLQVGPHAYTYDVDPNFTLAGEIMHASSYTPVFKGALTSRLFTNFLEAEHFNHEYIDNLVQRYIDGETLYGSELSDITNLAIHSAIGIYGI